MSECTTHHHACDCREAQFAALECEAEEQSRLIERQSELLRGVASALKSMCGNGRHNLADLPRLAQAVIAERDELRRLIEGAPGGRLLGLVVYLDAPPPSLFEGKRVRLVVEDGE